jgi:23S rRNA (cytosine1962-C5)-methyltransferase
VFSIFAKNAFYLASQFINTIQYSIKPKRLAVKLSAKGEKSVLQNHPWIFSDSILKIQDDASSGDIAIIFGKRRNSVMGIGLYDAESPIRIKMVHFGGSQTIDTAFFNSKIALACAKREALLKTATNSYRLLFGENDEFPGLIADVYADVLVVKLYSSIWLPYLEALLETLVDVSGSKTVVIRLSRRLQQMDIELNDGDVVYGTLANEVVNFVEHSVNFSANVIKGHKTGYFLDHRANRKRVGELSTGKTVLDVFAYAGGFSVHALANGAKEVTSLDISTHALNLAKENAKLNEFSGTHKTIAGDAFEELQRLIDQGIRYDVVVIDPPSFAKQQSEITIAKKKYRLLAELGIKLTTNNGLLVLASCSSRIFADDFFEINTQVLNASKRAFNTVLKTTHDLDHPIAFKEGAYLKCGYYKLDIS